MTSHVYPMHTHEAWTLLIVDNGIISYDLDRHEHGALRDVVTLLPPRVPHNGHAATTAGFHKRVLYLDLSQLPACLIGPAVDRPVLTDPLLRNRIHQLHETLRLHGEELAAESHLALVTERLQQHLTPRSRPHSVQPGDTGQSLTERAWQPRAARTADLAGQLRELVDASFQEKVTLREASQLLHAHPAHLVRTFTREFGISPHRYLTGRRVDLARRLLLDGMPPSLAAAAAGFCDQAHLTRTFKQLLGTTPGRYARSGR